MAGMTKVETYLIDLDVDYQEVSEGTFFINDETKGLPGLIVTIDEPVVVIRAKVMEVPASRKPELLETLLKLNAGDITHGAYAIDGQDVVIIDTLQYETMDKGEFEASIDSIGMALSGHYSLLSTFRD